jgi:hypothetical protein
MFLQPELEPVDRLVKNAEAYAEAHPSDSAAQYTLARIHYLAFALRIQCRPVFSHPITTVSARRRLITWSACRQKWVGEIVRSNSAREELGVKGDVPSDPEQMQRFWQAVTRITEKLKAENWTPTCAYE